MCVTAHRPAALPPTRRPHAAVVACILALLVAAPTPAQTDAPSEPLVFHLKYTVGDGLGVYLLEDLLANSPSFRQEPDWNGSEVDRGSFKTGPGKHNLIGFAFDRTGGRLYVDLNGNRDLTDDPEGVFKPVYSSPRFAWFDEVRLLRHDESGTVPYVLDVSFMREDCSAVIHSAWHGTATLAGREWVFTVADNMDGVIDDQDPLFVWSREGISSEWCEEVPAAGRFMLDDSVYEISCALGSPEEALLTAVPLQVPMGGLTLAGQHIARLLMSGSGQTPTVLIDSPAEHLLIPIGTYDSQTVYLATGTGRTYCCGSSDATVVISEDKPALLTLGGPLNNALQVTRSGRDLGFGYDLRGRGGGQFEVCGTSLDDEPSVVIRKGPVTLAKGTIDDDFDYSWRVPLFAFGKLTFVASRDLYGCGPCEGAPITYYWNPLWNLAVALPWLLLALLLFRPANLNRKAWAVAIPLLEIIPPLNFARWFFTETEFEGISLGILALCLFAALLAVLWLLSDVFVRLRRRTALLAAVAAVAAFACAGVLSAYYVDFDRSVLLPVALCLGGGGIAFLISMVLTARVTRSRRTTRTFLLWFFLSGIALATAMPLCVTITRAIALFAHTSASGPVWVLFLEGALISIAAGLLYALVLTPFIILALKSPLYRTRLHALLGATPIH